MFVLDGNIYRKVSSRKKGSKFFIKNGKRVDYIPSHRHTIVSEKPRKNCPPGKERLPSGRCSKKCIPPKTRNHVTNRCKSPARRSSPPRSSPARRSGEPRFFDLSNGNDYITYEKEKEMYESGLKKYILENSLRHGDIIYIGSSIQSRPEYGYYFVDIRKPNRVITNEGLYAIDPYDNELYDEVMDNYIQMLGSPIGLSYHNLKQKILDHLILITGY